MNNTKNTRLIRFVQLAALVALLIVFSFTGLGYIKIGAVEITLNVIPVAVGAIVLGPAAGAVCGAVFGATSFIQCFGLSAFGAALLQINPLLTFVMCFFPRLLTGWLTGIIFKAFKNQNPGCIAASLCCPLINTVLFIGCFIAFFGRTEFFASLYSDFGKSNLFLFIIAFVGINGACEAVACTIISSAVSKALLKANKRFR